MTNGKSTKCQITTYVVVRIPDWNGQCRTRRPSTGPVLTHNNMCYISP